MTPDLPPPRVLYTDPNGGQIRGYTEIDMLNAMAGRHHSTPDPMRLSAVEAQCLAAIIDHGTAKAAGKALNRSPKTIEATLKRVRERVGLHTTLQTCVAYVRRGVIT